MGFARCDGIKVGVRGQEARDHGAVHARPGGDVGQHGGVADVAPLDPVGPHLACCDKGLAPLEPGPVDDAVGVQRVGDALGRVGVHPDAVLFGNLAEAVMDRLKLSLGAEARDQVGALVHACGGHVGVQLERMPFDAERVVGMTFQRAVEIGLAEIAPRADRVGKDVKLHHGDHSTGLQRRLLAAGPARSARHRPARGRAASPC